MNFYKVMVTNRLISILFTGKRGKTHSKLSLTERGTCFYIFSSPLDVTVILLSCIVSESIALCLVYERVHVWGIHVCSECSFSILLIHLKGGSQKNCIYMSDGDQIRSDVLTSCESDMNYWGITGIQQNCCNRVTVVRNVGIVCKS